MSVDTGALRAALAAHIEAHRRAAREATAEAGCEHSFKRYRETVRADNAKFGGRTAHFVTLGCTKCHAKRRIDYAIQ